MRLDDDNFLVCVLSLGVHICLGDMISTCSLVTWDAFFLFTLKMNFNSYRFPFRNMQQCTMWFRHLGQMVPIHFRVSSHAVYFPLAIGGFSQGCASEHQVKCIEMTIGCFLGLSSTFAWNFWRKSNQAMLPDDDFVNSYPLALLFFLL